MKDLKGHVNKDILIGHQVSISKRLNQELACGRRAFGHSAHSYLENHMESMNFHNGPSDWPDVGDLDKG